MSACSQDTFRTLLREAPPGGRRALAHLAAIALVLLVSSRIVLPRVLDAPYNNDDVTWAKRSLAPLAPPQRETDSAVAAESTSIPYHYAVDHPALARIIYGLALRASGITEVKAEEWDDTVSVAENLFRGRVLDKRTRTILRLVNVLFCAGALVFVYLGLDSIVRNAPLAAAGALAFVLEPSVTAESNGVITYIGADAVFLFFLVSLWYVWLRSTNHGPACIVVMGLLGGLATATKVNGSFAIAGLLFYEAITSRGWQRAARPAAVAAVAALLFVLINPVLWTSSLSEASRVLQDMFARRVYIARAYESVPYSPWIRTAFAYLILPHLYFLLPTIGLALPWRRERWLQVTASWCVSIALLHVLLLPRHIPRYEAPLREAFLVLLFAVGLRTLQGAVSPRDEEGKPHVEVLPSDEPASPGAP